jgi:hypothetical protein
MTIWEFTKSGVLFDHLLIRDDHAVLPDSALPAVC